MIGIRIRVFRHWDSSDQSLSKNVNLLRQIQHGQIGQGIQSSHRGNFITGACFVYYQL